MPKVDSQGRICIPQKLREIASLDNSKEITIYYENGKLFIVDSSENLTDKCIVAIQSIDSKGRIFVNTLLDLIDATKDDFFVALLTLLY